MPLSCDLGISSNIYCSKAIENYFVDPRVQIGVCPEDDRGGVGKIRRSLLVLFVVHL